MLSLSNVLLLKLEGDTLKVAGPLDWSFRKVTLGVAKASLSSQLSCSAVFASVPSAFYKNVSATTYARTEQIPGVMDSMADRRPD